MLITENCIINGMPEKLYHSDPTPVLDGFAMSASFSSSMGTAMVEETEIEAFLSNSRLNPNYKEETGSKAAEVGTIAHSVILLGTSKGVYEIAPFADFKKDAAKEARDNIEARGLIALNNTTADRILTDVDAMKKALREQLDAHKDYPGLMAKGKGEQSAFVFDGTIWNRARLDWEDELYPDTVVDYKTTGLTFDQWEKNELWGKKYMQEAHYRKVKSLIVGRPVTFIFVVQQTFYPFLVKVIKIDESCREEVTERYEASRRRFIRCLKTGVWRGIPPYTAHSYPPPWVVNKWTNDAMDKDTIDGKENPPQPSPADCIAAG